MNEEDDEDDDETDSGILGDKSVMTLKEHPYPMGLSDAKSHTYYIAMIADMDKASNAHWIEKSPINIRKMMQSISI